MRQHYWNIIGRWTDGTFDIWEINRIVQFPYIYFCNHAVTNLRKEELLISKDQNDLSVMDTLKEQDTIAVQTNLEDIGIVVMV